MVASPHARPVGRAYDQVDGIELTAVRRTWGGSLQAVWCLATLAYSAPISAPISRTEHTAAWLPWDWWQHVLTFVPVCRLGRKVETDVHYTSTPLAIRARQGIYLLNGETMCCQQLVCTCACWL